MADSVASELDKLHSDVGAQDNVLDSLETLFHGLCARLKNAIRMGLASDASDAHLAPFQDLLTGLEARGPDLAAAVMANTPHRDEHPDHEADAHDQMQAAPVPEGVSTADDAPLPSHDPNAPVEEEVPFAERVTPPIRTEVGSNYIPAPIAPGNPVVEPVEPFAEATPSVESAPDEGHSVEPAEPEVPPAHAAEAHDQHGAQAEANVTAHANDHDAKKPAADA